MKRMLLIAASAAIIAGPAAFAQVGDLTGRVTGQADQTSRATADALGQDAVIDQRTGLALDTQLTGRLDRELSSFDAGSASADLRPQLEAEANAYGRVNDDSVGASASSRSGSRLSARNETAPVAVYASDGVRVGTVERVGGGELVIRGESDGESRTVLSDQAAFDSAANAVVLARSSAEFAGEAAGDAASEGQTMAQGAVEGAVDAAAQTGADAAASGQAAAEDAAGSAQAGASAGADAAADLQAALPRFDASQASEDLLAGLQSSATGVASGAGSATGPAAGVGAEGSASGSASGSAMGGVPVYTADGVLIGHADGMTETGDAVNVRHASSGEMRAVSAGQAAFHDDANAVVLAMSEAEFESETAAW